MKVFHNFNDLQDSRHGWVTIGNFDGVHLGHQKMLKQLVVTAQLADKPAVVVTFDPPPLALLAPERVPPRLTTIQQKRELLAGLGIDFLFEIAPTHEFLEQSPVQFFNFFMRDKLAATGIIEGDNFRFGHHRAGDIHLLSELCKAASMKLEIITPIMHEGYVISSTSIRQALFSGDMQTANSFLARPYSITGKVVIGEQRGRVLGFPTANLDDIETLIPGSGVYKGQVTLGNKNYKAAIHLGENLTFQGQTKKVEVHILEFSGDLYGQQLTVDFLQKIRDIRKFSGKEELLQQIRTDIQSINDTDDNDPNASFLSLDLTKLRNQLENS